MTDEVLDEAKETQAEQSVKKNKLFWALGIIGLFLIIPIILLFVGVGLLTNSEVSEDTKQTLINYAQDKYKQDFTFIDSGSYSNESPMRRKYVILESRKIPGLKFTVTENSDKKSNPFIEDSYEHLYLKHQAENEIKINLTSMGYDALPILYVTKLDDKSGPGVTGIELITENNNAEKITTESSKIYALFNNLRRDYPNIKNFTILTTPNIKTCVSNFSYGQGYGYYYYQCEQLRIFDLNREEIEQIVNISNFLEMGLEGLPYKPKK